MWIAPDADAAARRRAARGRRASPRRRRRASASSCATATRPSAERAARQNAPARARRSRALARGGNRCPQDPELPWVGPHDPFATHPPRARTPLASRAASSCSAVGVVLAVAGRRRAVGGRLRRLDRRRPRRRWTRSSRATRAASRSCSTATASKLGVIQARDLRKEIPSDQIPQTLKDATVAIEDARFYKHKGVDYDGRRPRRGQEPRVRQARCRAARRSRCSWSARSTAPTEKTYERKIREAKLAEELENEHSKDWILTKYLNTVPYGTYGGQTALGVWAAAKTYFNKLADGPDARPGRAAGRPAAGAVAVLAGPLARRPPRRAATRCSTRWPSSDFISDAAGRGGARRRTSASTCRRTSRRAARTTSSTTSRTSSTSPSRRAWSAAAACASTRRSTSTSRSGAHRDRRPHRRRRPLVGDRDDRPRQRRDPRHGVVVRLRQVEVQPRRPGPPPARLVVQDDGADGRAAPRRRPRHARTTRPSRSTSTTRRTGTSRSRPTTARYSRLDEPAPRRRCSSDNSVYMQLALDLGPENVKETADDMGITTKLDGYPAETLGGLTIGVSPLEMANAYATIASGGVYHKPIAITKIRTADGDVLKGKTLPKRLRPVSERRFQDGVTYEATKILEDNVQGGTGTKAADGLPRGGQDRHDRRALRRLVRRASRPQLSSAVWVGYPDAQVHMYTEYHGGSVAGGTFPAEIWGDYTRAVKGGVLRRLPAAGGADDLHEVLRQVRDGGRLAASDGDRTTRRDPYADRRRADDTTTRRRRRTTDDGTDGPAPTDRRRRRGHRRRRTLRPGRSTSRRPQDARPMAERRPDRRDRGGRCERPPGSRVVRWLGRRLRGRPRRTASQVISVDVMVDGTHFRARRASTRGGRRLARAGRRAVRRRGDGRRAGRGLPRRRRAAGRRRRRRAAPRARRRWPASAA